MQQIVATIPDSLYIKFCDRKTSCQLWTAVKGSFENRLRMVAVNLHQKLQSEQFTERGDLQAHFDNLHKMCEELVVLDCTLDKDDFYVIMSSLPSSFDNHISSINGTSTMTSTTLSPDSLMTAVLDEQACPVVQGC